VTQIVFITIEECAICVASTASMKVTKIAFISIEECAICVHVSRWEGPSDPGTQYTADETKRLSLCGVKRDDDKCNPLAWCSHKCMIPDNHPENFCLLMTSVRGQRVFQVRQANRSSRLSDNTRR
jgi:hypothetical protein